MKAKTKELSTRSLLLRLEASLKNLVQEVRECRRLDIQFTVPDEDLQRTIIVLLKEILAGRPNPQPASQKKNKRRVK